MSDSVAKVIVITGVSRGLGRAMAKGFAERGHIVCGCARKSSDLTSLQKELGDAHVLQAVNVADDAEVSNWARSVIDRFGAPDFLINNAAVINRNEKLWKIPAEEFDRSLAVNVSGPANVIRHFVPSMVERKQGVIVNFSSGWGRSVAAEVAPYCATKWAIEGLTQALAEELPHGMCAVPLNPGIIDTDMLRSCFSSGAESFPKPETWAQRAVPFILNLRSEHNGQPLSVPD